MNKKGFTLVELLAVIAILAILVVMAVPNVINLFNGAKVSTFISQAESLYKSAEQQVVANQMRTTSSSSYVFCSQDSTKKLNLSGSESIHYYVRFDGSGKMTDFYLEDGSYAAYITGTDIKLSDIAVSGTGNSSSVYANLFVLASGQSINTCPTYSDSIPTTFAGIKGATINVE